MKVNAAMTTYEHACFIARALDSILAQETDFPFEEVVVDDGSRDGTREIVADYAARFPGRVRAVLPAANLGAGGKRLFAEVVAACRGSYIACLDGDDFWTSTAKLQRQADFLDAHADCSMCFHNVALVDEEGRPTGEVTNPPERPPIATAADLFERNFVPACSPMFRREALWPLPVWYFDLPWGDWPLYLIAAERGRVGYLPEVMGTYRVHGSGMWSRLTRVERLLGLIDFVRQANACLGYRHDPAVRRSLARLRLGLAREHERLGDWPRTAAAALASLAGRPWGHPAYADALRLCLPPRVRGLRARALGRPGKGRAA